MPDSICSLLAHIFRTNAHRAFLLDVANNRTLTYSDVLKRAAGVATCLKRLGISRGSRVGISMPNGADFALLYFGCLLGGVTAVPINAALPLCDRAFVLGRCRLSGLIVRDVASEEELVSALGGVPPVAIEYLLHESPEEADSLIGSVAADAWFSIHFTSGTTNLPKAVPHRVGSLLENARAFNRTLGIDRSARFVHVLPMAYMAGFLNSLLCPLMAEATVIVAPQFTSQSALRFWDSVEAHAGDTVWMTPTMLATLSRVDRSQKGSSYCRRTAVRILSATAPLPIRIRNEFEQKYSTAVIESYGLSELLLISANVGLTGTKSGSVGPPIQPVEVTIKSDDGIIQPPGISGAIYVKTPHRTLGYLDYETGEPISPSEWFDTGDVGYVDSDGYLFITGRRKDLIIRGGMNISPRAIEEILQRHPSVQQTAVVGLPHPFYGEEVVAAVVIDDRLAIDTVAHEVRAMCRAEIGENAALDRIVAVDALPTGSTGKVQKQALVALLRGGE